MNLFYLGAISKDTFCADLAPVWTIFGYIIFAIQVIVPLLLIIYGMISMAKAIMGKDEKEIKAAQNLLVKRIIAAVLVFLIITIVGIVVNLVADKEYEKCARCAFHPFDLKSGCGLTPARTNE